MDVETYTAPPEPDEDEDGDYESTRVSVHLMPVDGSHADAAVQLFDTDAHDPEKIADAVLRTALAVGQMAGPDVGWAVQRRLASYDGGLSGRASTDGDQR